MPKQKNKNSRQPTKAKRLFSCKKLPSMKYFSMRSDFFQPPNERSFLFMAKSTKVLEKIEEMKGKINPRYDMRVSEISQISKKSKDVYDLICNGFAFGYYQGMKAAKAEMQKNSSVTNV